jgi:hypothetical protein
MQNTFGQRLLSALMGQQAIPTDTIATPTTNENGETFIDATVSQNPRVGGILPDIAAGYKENRTTPFSLDNFIDKEISDGRKKGFAYRFGEGLGTLKRFADSPAGRGVITAGLVLGTGGGALPALAFGGSATLGNQQYRLNDRMYRDDLIRTGRQYVMNTPEYATANDEEQQAMLNEVDNRINGYRGYINKDIYRNMIDSQIAQENAAYRRMYYDNQRKQDEINTWLAQQKFNYQKGQDAISNAQEWARINMLKNNKINNNLNNLNAVSSQLQRFENTFKNMPNKIESNTLGRLRAATGFQTKEEANFNSQRQLLFNKIARDLGGEKGVLSDQDIKRIEGALPNYTDSYAQKQAKMAAIYDLLNDRLAIEGGKLLAQPNTQDGRQTKNGVKYEVID